MQTDTRDRKWIGEIRNMRSGIKIIISEIPLGHLIILEILPARSFVTSSNLPTTQRTTQPLEEPTTFILHFKRLRFPLCRCMYSNCLKSCLAAYMYNHTAAEDAGYAQSIRKQNERVSDYIYNACYMHAWNVCSVRPTVHNE